MPALTNLLSPQESLIVTDTETTGVHAHVNRVIEIGAVKVRSEGENKWFDQLIDPQIAIPGRITRITGITSSMVFGQPTAEVVMPSYQEFLGNGVFVAHNIRFDYSFLNAEFERVGLPEMQNLGLCTLRLARRLLPGLRSKSLGNLAKFYRISAAGQHRARKDVEITLEVLERLAQIASEEHSVSTLGELLELQSRTYSKVKPAAKHVLKVRADVLPKVPGVPGVYHMVDGKGRILYVGKAKNLKQRVSSYFRAIEAHPPRLRQLIAKMRNVSWRETSTELHALIEESREIKELDPPFNRAQKKYVHRPYLRLDSNEPFPRLTTQVFVRDDGSEYFGPLRNRSQAWAITEIVERYFPIRNCSSAEFAKKHKCVRADIGRCGAPCDGSQGEEAYGEVTQRVRDFLMGDITNVCAMMELEMLKASEQFAFEDAAETRDWISMLDERVTKYGAVATPVSGPDTVHLLAAGRAGSGTFAIVRQGRITSVEAVDSALEVEQFVLLAYSASPDSTAVMDRIQIDARRILDHWLYVKRDKVTSLEKREEEPEEHFAIRVAEHFEALDQQGPDKADSYNSM